MQNETNIKKILELIRAHERIVILRHVGPDGDAHGSAVGLRSILRASYLKKDIRYFSKDASEYVDFLGCEEKEDPSFYDGALAIVLDTANTSRVSSNYLSSCASVIKIDHHPVVEEFGVTSYVDDSSPACAVLLYRLIQAYSPEWKMTKDAALALYVGITTDTGRFRYRGTNEEVMTIAGKLITLGHIDLEKLYSRLYIKTADVVRFGGYVYQHFHLTKHGVAWIWLSRALIERHHIVSYDESSNMVNNLDGIEGSEIWIAFIEAEGEIRVRLRSRYVDIRALAARYAGGGHPNACGARLKSKRQIKSFLADADAILEEYHQLHPSSH